MSIPKPVTISYLYTEMMNINTAVQDGLTVPFALTILLSAIFVNSISPNGAVDEFLTILISVS